MSRYVALLRGINVGGRNLVKMDDLKLVFEKAGFKNVHTLIVSGNVTFDAPKSDPTKLARKIEKLLLKAFAFEIPVAVLTIEALQAMVKRDPFKGAIASKDVGLYVTFFSSGPSEKPKGPLAAEKEKLEFLEVRDGAAFVIVRRKSDGTFAFPNGFIEKSFGARATTRNWNTVQRLAAGPKK